MEMEEVFNNVDNDYQEIAEPEHFDEVLQGTLDTVEGIESMRTTFTKAQSYLYSCLDSSGGLTYQDTVGGLEGVFGAIGNGISAAWEYIKKLFKTVYEFFFGSSDKSVEEKASKTDKAIESNEKSAKDQAAPGKSEEVVEKLRKNVKSRAKKVEESPKSSSTEKAKAKDIQKRIDEGNVKSTRDKEADVLKCSEELAAIDKGVREFLIKRVGETENLRRKYATYAEKDRSKEIGAGRFKSMYKVFHESLNGATFGKPIQEIVKVDQIKTISIAAATQSTLREEVAKHARFAKFISSEKNDFEIEIKTIQELVDKKTKASNKGQVLGESYKNKDELRERLAAANAALSIVNATAGFQTKMLMSLERLSESVNDIFGICI